MVEYNFIVPLVVAALLGSLLGLERSIAGKHAGMRTYALVCLGSCLFTVIGLIASFEFAQFASINPLQVAGYLVVGVGFIGSGLAIARGNHPGELTTATGIWLVAAVGVAAGFSMYVLATVATVLGILIFTLLSKVENGLKRRFGTENE